MTAPHLALSAEAREQLPRDLDDHLLRISFTTGCGGSGYRLSKTTEPVDGDTIVDLGEVRIAMDDMAVRNLDGATIVYDEIEEGYLVDHPSAAVSAWCG